MPCGVGARRPGFVSAEQSGTTSETARQKMICRTSQDFTSLIGCSGTHFFPKLVVKGAIRRLRCESGIEIENFDFEIKGSHAGSTFLEALDRCFNRCIHLKQTAYS